MNGYNQVVEVFAEEIQADPVAAVTNSWQVMIYDGKITGEKTT